MRAAQLASLGTPGPEGSTGKLQWADLQKKIYEFAIGLLGPDALGYPSTYEMTIPDAAFGRRDTQKNFLRSRANSIEGGTSEIMRNILGERVLGLPGEPRGRQGNTLDRRPPQLMGTLRVPASLSDPVLPTILSRLDGREAPAYSGLGRPLCRYLTWSLRVFRLAAYGHGSSRSPSSGRGTKTDHCRMRNCSAVWVGPKGSTAC